MTSLLELREVSKNFGGIEAVRRVSLEVSRSEILGLMGPNGAGKSTVLSLIAGGQPVSAGHVVFRDEDVTRVAEHRRVRRGLARVLQHGTHLEEHSVQENVSLGFAARAARPGGWKQWRDRLRSLSDSHERARRTTSLDVLRQVGLEHRADDAPAALSHWERRLLSVGRALATDPTLVLLDEPLAGLSEAEAKQFTALVRRLRDLAGKTFVIVEHRIDALLRLCDRIVVLHHGSKIADDVPRRISQDPLVRAVYLGDETWHS